MMKIVSILFAMIAIWPFNTQKVSDEDWQATTEIVYQHSDPSVSPDYYRKYTLSVTATEAVLTIGDYSKELSKKRYRMTAKTFKAFVERLKGMGIRRVKEKESFATGCDYESLSLLKGDSRYFHAYATCDAGNLKVESGSLEKAIATLIPNLEKAIEQTRKN